MQVSIEQVAPLLCVGKKIQTSLLLQQNKTLWQAFMRERNQIKNQIDDHLYAIEIYPPHYFDAFNPNLLFEKWAALAVSSLQTLPSGFDSVSIPAGLYAKFHYVGHQNKGQEAMMYIFNEWLPQSNYAVDQRPHFEQMGSGYNNNRDDSEEYFFVPIKPKPQP